MAHQQHSVVQPLALAHALLMLYLHGPGYLAHGTATDYMYERLKVPLSFTWEIYGDADAHFYDCFRMFNPVTREAFDQARRFACFWSHM